MQWTLISIEMKCKRKIRHKHFYYYHFIKWTNGLMKKKDLLFHTLTPWWHLKFEYVYRSDDDDALTAFFALNVFQWIFSSAQKMCNRIQIRALVFHISQSDSFIYMETASFCDNRLSVCRPYFIVWLKGTQSSIPFISFMPLQTVFTSSLSFACALRLCRLRYAVACYCCFCHIRDRSTDPP